MHHHRHSNGDGAMSIGSISGSTNWWQNQATQAASISNAGTTAAASPTSDSITNTGTVAAGNVSSFMQSFSADLQAMLTQLGDEANPSATSATSSAASTSTSTSTATSSSTTASATNPTDPTQSQGEVHHHHHHMQGGDEGGSMANTANQLVGEIGQSSQGGTLGAGQINQSASVFAGDVMQALQSYGSTAAASSLPPILA
jgi:hypothetical protein